MIRDAISCCTSLARRASIDLFIERWVFIAVGIFIESVVLKIANFGNRSGNQALGKTWEVSGFLHSICVERLNISPSNVRDVHFRWIDGSTVGIRRYLTMFTEIDMPDKWCSLIGTPIRHNGDDDNGRATPLPSFPSVLCFKPVLSGFEILTNCMCRKNNVTEMLGIRKNFDDRVNEVTSRRRKDSRWSIFALDRGVKSKNILFVSIWCEKRNILFAFAKKTCRSYDVFADRAWQHSKLVFHFN